VTVVTDPKIFIAGGRRRGRAKAFSAEMAAGSA